MVQVKMLKMMVRAHGSQRMLGCDCHLPQENGLPLQNHRSPGQFGKGVQQELSMEMNKSMAKNGSPLNITINHRSGERVENKTYVKQRNDKKYTEKTRKLKWKWKSVDHHGGRIKTVQDSQRTVVTIMQGVWVGWFYCQLPKKSEVHTKSTELYGSRKKRFKIKRKMTNLRKWFLFIAQYKIVRYNFYI